MCYFRGELEIDEINSNFDNFESTLPMKSVSLPLIILFFQVSGYTSLSFDLWLQLIWF